MFARISSDEVDESSIELPLGPYKSSFPLSNEAAFAKQESEHALHRYLTMQWDQRSTA